MVEKVHEFYFICIGVAHYFAVLSDGPALVQLNDVFVPL